MASEKPLPAIPSSRTPPITLTVEARKRRLRFVRQVLQEDEVLRESDREGWAHCIEDALDELSVSFGRGGWLAGIKNGRALRTQRRASAQKKQVQGASTAQGKPDNYPSKLAGGTPSTLTLHQVKDLVAQSITPVPKSTTKHLLLCIAPLGSRIAASKYVDSIPLPASYGCSFTSGVFTLPDEELDGSASHRAVLLGLDGWDANLLDGPTRLVGGTFTFVGVTSIREHSALTRALRVATYVHLSLTLEQHFLADSHVQLNYPRQRIHSAHESYDQQTRGAEQERLHESKARQRQSLLPSPGSILSFITKKAGFHRSTTIASGSNRNAFLDLKPQPSEEPTSDHAGTTFRRFSFIHDARPSFLRPSSPTANKHPDLPFASIVDRLERSKDLCSTSLEVTIPLPSLIVDLAEKEKQFPSRRLKGDEKTGLSSILGWEGKEARGSGMAGIAGFVRQQGLSLLYAQHVPSEAVPPPAPESSSSSSSKVSLASLEPKPAVVSCGQPRWVTYRYYSREGTVDRCLGETISEWILCKDLPCSQPQCKFKRGQHERRFVHGVLRIGVKIQDNEDTTWQDGGVIESWQSCVVCQAKTERVVLSDGAYLFSFAKFLELLAYSPTINQIHPLLCTHTSPQSTSAPALSSASPPSHLNIIRHFHFGAGTVSFSLSSIEEIFELKVPRVQLLRACGDKATKDSLEQAEDLDEEKRTLRKEIKSWWEGVSDHIDKLETIFHGDVDHLDAIRKSLPRLPSSDDAYDDVADMADVNTTPKLSSIPGLPVSHSSSPHAPAESDDYPMREASSSPSVDTPSSISTTEADPAQLLSKLRYTFQRIEQSLYQQLSRTPTSSLNDVRRSFLCAALGASKRLLAWQRKHIPVEVREQIGDKVSGPEPEWWGKGYHAVPGGNVIVREDDWGSIIAFTLGTADYQRELASMSHPRGARAQPTTTTTSTPSTITSTGTSLFSPSRGFRFFTSSTRDPPDPDQDDVVWHEPEAFSSVISRKEHPKDAAYLLPIRDVLRQKAPGSGGETPSAPSASRFAAMGPGAGGAATLGSKQGGITPPSAWAKPEVQLNMQAVAGELNRLPDAPDSADKILHDIESAESSRPPSITGGTGSPESCSHHEETTSSSTHSDRTIGRGSQTASTTESAPAPAVPPKIPQSEHRATTSDATASQATSSASSLTTSFTNSIGIAMRFLSNRAEQSGPGTPTKNHHGLLHTENDHIDDKPHIKYDWTAGAKLKVSCTVYYAKEFDMLRRRCGIDDAYLRSLKRSTNWAAEGGKSRSNFWKTWDDRFIIKTLVNAWNVADLQVLLELAPSYFRYIESTANRSTVLAKMLGFYTIEVRNLESGNVHAKADLLVMENLLYQHKIVKTFDLKGIQGRKVKPGSHAPGAQHSKTLFDGEWIEGQQRTLTLVRPHSKVILREAIRNDADFLAKSNIMDYSLLLGVDEEHKQIACGLVDTIGSYTFAKTLEYKAKQGLNSGKEVTVIPPTEYHERFVNAIERYFLPCPDKWSQPMDGTKVISDPSQLPSVL